MVLRCWHTVVAAHVLLDAMVGVGACVLVSHHDLGVDVVVAQVGVVEEHTLVLGEGLESIFALKTHVMVEVGFNGITAMPDTPVVVVAIDAIGRRVLKSPGA